MTYNFESTFTREPYGVTHHIDATPVDFWDSHAVADCLVDNGDYDGYMHDASFDEAAVFQLALEDAVNIIKSRSDLLKARGPQSVALAAAKRSVSQRNIRNATRYVVVSTPVDQLQKIS